MKYITFDSVIAKEAGVHAAILFDYFLKCWAANLVRNENIYDDEVWAELSLKSALSFFDFLTEQEILQALRSLISKNLVIAKDLEIDGYDDYVWFSCTKKAEKLANKQEISFPDIISLK